MWATSPLRPSRSGPEPPHEQNPHRTRGPRPGSPVLDRQVVAHVRLRTPLALFGAALLVLAGPPLLTQGSGADTGTHIPGLRVMVPNTPGGGYDITARTLVKDAEDAELI